MTEAEEVEAAGALLGKCAGDCSANRPIAGVGQRFLSLFLTMGAEQRCQSQPIRLS